MARLKIELEKGETPESAQELILKAFQAQVTGETHGEEYNDPAMREIMARMESAFKRESELMIQEIIQALEEEYKDNGDI